jgi:uncharacterized membrane protein YkoI
VSPDDYTCSREARMKTVGLVVAALVLSAVSARGQETYKKDIPDSLAKRAKVTESAAAEAAQKRVPKGKIEGVELEVEKGKLLYSYDLKTEGKSGADEVHVDAMTGKVVSVHHESAAAEKKEEAAEKKPKKP